MIDRAGIAGRFEAILDNLPLLVFLKDRENRFLYTNKYVLKAFGKDRAEITGASLYDLYDAETARRFHEDDLEVIASGVPKMDIEEIWEVGDGVRWVSTSKLPFRGPDGEIAGVLGISIDITERKRKDRIINSLIQRLESEKRTAVDNAMIDGLTGIHNRRYLDANLMREVERAHRKGEAVTILMIDIDLFKKYNDHYGHLLGDDCLRKVAGALKAAVHRPGDFVARYGGEEFVIVLPETEGRGAENVVRRIRALVADLRLEHRGSEIDPFLTVSIGGVTVHPGAVLDSGTILAKVDAELYRAKGMGRNSRSLAELGEAPSPSEHSFVEITWDSRYVSNNETINRQHHGIFDKANELIRSYTTNDAEAARGKARELVEALRGHFDDEVRILQEVRYPGSGEHNESHRRLLAGLEGLVREAEGAEGIQDLVKYLVFDVALDHMEREDTKFYPYL